MNEKCRLRAVFSKRMRIRTCTTLRKLRGIYRKLLLIGTHVIIVNDPSFVKALLSVAAVAGLPFLINLPKLNFGINSIMKLPRVWIQREGLSSLTISFLSLRLTAYCWINFPTWQIFETPDWSECSRPPSAGATNTWNTSSHATTGRKTRAHPPNEGARS